MMLDFKNKFFNYAALPAVGLLALGLSFTPAAAAQRDSSTPTSPAGQSTAPNSHQTANAQKLVDQANSVVKEMKGQPNLVKLMAKAKGIYIVPNFGRGAFIVGGRGGSGVLLVKEGDNWSEPAFYNFGGISVGAQIGGSGGPIAFLLMNEHAVNAFRTDNRFSLNTGAGFTIVKYSNNAQASWGKGDIVLWSHTKGAYAGATVSVSDIVWNSGYNQHYYGNAADLTHILNGNVKNSGADQLRQDLPG